jgi:O-antigen/teichoic acid export membrane protein
LLRAQTKLNPLSLRRNFSWALIGNVVYGLSQLAILVVIAKMGTQEMVGQFTLGIAVITPVAFLLNMNLRAVQATDVQQKYCFGDYLGLRAITNIIALSCICLIITLSQYSSDTKLIIIILGVYRLIEYLSDAFYGFWQQHERIDKVAQSTALRNILALLAMALVLRSTNSLILGVLSLLGCALVILLTFDLSVSIRLVRQIIPQAKSSDIYHFLQPRFVFVQCMSLVKLSLPIGVSWMLLSLSSNIPRYVIEHYHGMSELGLFSAIAYLPTAGTTVVYALGQASLTRLSKFHSGLDFRAFQRLLSRLVILVLGMGLSALLLVSTFGKLILSTIYNPVYGEQSYLFTLLMLWGAIYYVAWCLDYAATAAQRFRQALTVSSIKVVVVIVGSFLLIPRYGTFGAVMVLLLDGCVQLVGMSVVVVHEVQKMKRLAQAL